METGGAARKSARRAADLAAGPESSLRCQITKSATSRCCRARTGPIRDLAGSWLIGRGTKSADDFAGYLFSIRAIKRWVLARCGHIISG